MKKKVRRRLIFGGAVAAALAVGVVGTAVVMSAFSLFRSPFGTEETHASTEVIQAVERIGEVALVSAYIQGIEESRGSSTVFGVGIPGTGRVLYTQYSFTAKLGVDGERVRIAAYGEHGYDVRFPSFEFIGHSDVDFETAVESNGALSFVTPDIDQYDVVNSVLNNAAQGEYLAKNDDILREQAKSFYTSLIQSVDPEADISFYFAD